MTNWYGHLNPVNGSYIDKLGYASLFAQDLQAGQEWWWQKLWWLKTPLKTNCSFGWLSQTRL